MTTTHDPDSGAAVPGPIDRLLGVFSDVRAGEGQRALLMLANIFLILVCYFQDVPGISGSRCIGEPCVVIDDFVQRITEGFGSRSICIVVIPRRDLCGYWAGSEAGA